MSVKKFSDLMKMSYNINNDIILVDETAYLNLEKNKLLDKIILFILSLTL